MLSSDNKNVDADLKGLAVKQTSWGWSLVNSQEAIHAQEIDIYPTRNTYFTKVLNDSFQEFLTPTNQKILSEYKMYLQTTGKTSPARNAKLLIELRKLAKWTQDLGLGDLSVMDKRKVQVLITHVNSQDFQLSTKVDYRRVIKQFYKWYKDEDPRFYDKDLTESLHKFYLYLEKDLSVSYPRNQVNPNTIITEEDLAIVVKYGCRNLQEKAFNATLHDSGTRTKEFLGLRIEDVKFLSLPEAELAELHVDGKTGKRVIYIKKSVELLRQYVNSHPFKHDKRAFLWVVQKKGDRHRGKPFTYNTANKLVKRCFVRSQVCKKYNLHWFRHSCASILAPKLSQAMLCKFMGWSLDSRQVKTYVHLSNDQLRDSILML